MVERYGAQAVFGRVLGLGEMRRMAAADNVYRAFKSRARSEDWGKWSMANPESASLLERAAWLNRGEHG